MVTVTEEVSHVVREESYCISQHPTSIFLLDPESFVWGWGGGGGKGDVC